MQLLAIVSDMRFQDVLDILFLSFVAYHLYLWFYGTKAFKVLLGLLVFGAIFTVARAWGLFLTTWVFQVLWQVLVILLVILFQKEIRQVLEKLNPLLRIGPFRKSRPGQWTSEFAEAVFALARRKIGALIILERTDGVEEWITAGQQMEADPAREILISIFQKESPIHDGAVLIRNGRIAEVACYLPLTPEESLPKKWGTRHRAAIGLAERCDAWVIVVSEERGEVSLAGGGKMTRIDNAEELARYVTEAFESMGPAEKNWMERIRSFAFLRWQAKLLSFGLVSILWLLLAGQQDFEVTFQVPITAANLPENMLIVSPVSPKASITVRGLRKDASTLDADDIAATVDVARARPGKAVYPFSSDNIEIPVGRLHVINIEPSRIEFIFEKASGK